VSNTKSRARIAILSFALISISIPAGAQQIEELSTQAAASSALIPQEGTGQKVAAAEEPAKPARRFVPALFHNLGDDIKHIPRKNTLYWLAWGTAASLAIHPADDWVNNHLSTSESAKDVFVLGKYIGSFPVLIGAAGTTYVVGKARSSQRGQHLGMDLIEATLLADGLTELTKVVVRRERPIRDDGTRASGFAFPSGHSAGTFAAATVLQQHLGWKWAVPTYSIASYVAMSRLVDDRHWASDVTAGAALGIIVGRSVTWHGRNFYASPMLLPKGYGIAVNVKP
jgi:membrane-associated phospholipid phosphatase